MCSFTEVIDKEMIMAPLAAMYYIFVHMVQTTRMTYIGFLFLDTVYTGQMRRWEGS